MRLIQIETSWRKNSVSVLPFILPLSHLSHFIVAAWKTWRSPIYSFFKPDIAVKIHKGCVSHFFQCAMKRCKTDARGIQRCQDKGDMSSTANLHHHAICCFGEDCVNTTVNGPGIKLSGNIFNLFARQGQQPVSVSHRSHTNSELW